MENKNNVFVVLLIFLAVLCVVFNNKITQIFQSKDKVQVEQSTIISHVKDKNDFYPPNETIKNYSQGCSAPISLSGKSKKEIYDIRKDYVRSSIFANEDYEPSEEVFGQIESGKPWISANVCKDPKTHNMRTTGASEESRFIVNPNVLVALEYPFSYSNYPDEDWCADDTINMLPEILEYDGYKKEIKVYYRRLPFSTNDDFSFYQFNGLNARDLGYRYAYVDMAKSSFKPVFTDSDNIGTRAVEFRNFLHLGGSCGVEGGCNNGSPRQTYLEFKQSETDYSYSNGEIYIKLWRKEPSSVEDEADIVEKIIIREY